MSVSPRRKIGREAERSGFVKQFATVIDAKGRPQLDANYVGLWNAINYVTQAVAQFGSPFLANKFGIRFNMYLFTLLKLVVSPLTPASPYNRLINRPS